MLAQQLLIDRIHGRVLEVDGRKIHKRHPEIVGRDLGKAHGVHGLFAHDVACKSAALLICLVGNVEGFFLGYQASIDQFSAEGRQSHDGGWLGAHLNTCLGMSDRMLVAGESFCKAFELLRCASSCASSALGRRIARIARCDLAVPSHIQSG